MRITLLFTLICLLTTHSYATVGPQNSNDHSRFYVSLYDVMAHPGQSITLRAKIERNIIGRPDVRNITVEFFGQNERVGTAVSHFDGYADLTYRAPEKPGKYAITAKTSSGERVGYLFVYEPNTRFFITDIDNTLTDFNEALLYTTPYQNIPMKEGALEGIQNLSQDYVVIFMTSRDDFLLRETRLWLSHIGFPDGALFVNDFEINNLSPEKYKKLTIQRLLSNWPRIEAAAGNASYDAAAYTFNNLRSYIFHKDYNGSIRVETWQEIVDQESD